MFPYNSLEFMAYERHKDWQQKAAKRRLIKSLRQQKANDQGPARQVRNWLGVQLVSWGLKLQGHGTTLPSQVVVARGTEA
jgi:hypothetical protein